MKKDFNINTDVVFNKYSHHLMNYVNQPQLYDNEIESVINDINYYNIGVFLTNWLI